MADILDSVRSKYGAVAESTLSSNDPGVKAVAGAGCYIDFGEFQKAVCIL
jgi:chloramphenicol 3-O-phosphotransferase